MKAVRTLILLLVLSALLIGCGDLGNGKTTDTAGTTDDRIYCGDETPSCIYFETLDEVLSFMNDPGEVGYHHNYVINHSKSIGYTYSVESTNQEFFRVGIAPYQTLFSDGGIVFDTPIKSNEYEYIYKVRILIKDSTVEYSGDIVEYSLKRFGDHHPGIKEEYIYRTFTAQNGLGDFCVEVVYDGIYYAYAEIDNYYYLSVSIDVNKLPEDVVDPDAYLHEHETHMDALEEFINSLKMTKVQV